MVFAEVISSTYTEPPTFHYTFPGSPYSETFLCPTLFIVFKLKEVRKDITIIEFLISPVCTQLLVLQGRSIYFRYSIDWLMWIAQQTHHSYMLISKQALCLLCRLLLRDWKDSQPLSWIYKQYERFCLISLDESLVVIMIFCFWYIQSLWYYLTLWSLTLTAANRPTMWKIFLNVKDKLFCQMDSLIIASGSALPSYCFSSGRYFLYLEQIHTAREQ